MDETRRMERDPLALPVDGPPPSPLFEAVSQHLEALDRAAAPWVGGVVHAPCPGLSVEGFGPLPLPLIPLVAGALSEVATPAPYGRGGDTLVDPDVRRCRQIGADQVQLVSPEWSALVAEIVADAAAGMGLEGEVQATLYKLLLYEPGDFFLPHRDSEKEDGMVGTLVVSLPSAFSGGELVVRHGEDAQAFALQSERVDRIAWAAFYADCLHEVRPLQEGVRAVLVFNLVRPAGVLPPLRLDGVVEAVREPLAAWASASDGPPKLCYLLDHRYTSAELAWARLKGADQARAEALARAASSLDMVVALGMVRIDETWSAQGRGWGAPVDVDPEDVELYEYIDGWIRVEGLVDRSGHRLGEVALELREDEVAPVGALDGEPPDAFHYHEATGNEGATAERTFRRAAVVVWPRSRHLDVLAQGGVDGLVHAMGEPGLDDEQIGGLAQRAASLLSQARDPRHSALLDAIAAGDSVGGLGSWVHLQLGHGFVDPSHAAALGRALAILDEEAAADCLSDIMAGSTWDSLWDNAATLDALRRHGAHPASSLAPALGQILATLAQGPPATGRGFRGPRQPTRRELSSLLAVTVQVLPERSEELLDLVREWPRLIGFDEVLVPSVVQVARQAPRHPYDAEVNQHRVDLQRLDALARSWPG